MSAAARSSGAVQVRRRGQGWGATRRRRGWRLTRRGRLVIGGMLTAVAAVLILPGLRGAASASGPNSAAEPVIIVVAEGDTVWDLALEHAPEGEDPDVYSALIVEHNDVDAAALRPGDVLALPRPQG